MNRKEIAVLLLVFLVIYYFGRNTMEDASNARGEGMVRIYDGEYDVVWGAVLSVVQSSQLSLVSADQETGEILAKRGLKWNSASSGEYVAVFVEPLQDNERTRVEVISKKVLKTNLFAPKWDEKLIESLDHIFESH